MPRLNIAAGHEASVESRGPGDRQIWGRRGPGENVLGGGRGGRGVPRRERQTRLRLDSVSPSAAGIPGCSGRLLATLFVLRAVQYAQHGAANSGGWR
jgi:hypothetical protein